VTDPVPDFGTFKIKKVIMHRVPKARRDEKATVLPELSEAPIELEAKDRSYLTSVCEPR
jgi:hypothetical protein